MSTLSTAARNAARNAVNALADAGAGTNPTLQYRTAADAPLLTINLNATKAIADASDGVSTFAAPAGEASWVGYSKLPTSAGTAAKVVLCDKAGTVVETYSLGTTGSGEEFTLTTLNLTTEVPITFSVAPTVTQLASYDPTP